MMVVKVHRDSRRPLHDQVAAQIRQAIAEGEIGPGEKMPPARDLAAVLGVNANTVFRALRMLRDEGVVDFRRGRAVTVSGDPPLRYAVENKARELLDFARSYGMSTADLIELIRQLP
jgi:GntR family transcriptional regulator